MKLFYYLLCGLLFSSILAMEAPRQNSLEPVTMEDIKKALRTAQGMTMSDELISHAQTGDLASIFFLKKHYFDNNKSLWEWWNGVGQYVTHILDYKYFYKKNKNICALEWPIDTDYEKQMQVKLHFEKLEKLHDALTHEEKFEAGDPTTLVLESECFTTLAYYKARVALKMKDQQRFCRLSMGLIKDYPYSPYTTRVRLSYAKYALQENKHTQEALDYIKPLILKNTQATGYAVMLYELMGQPIESLKLCAQALEEQTTKTSNDKNNLCKHCCLIFINKVMDKMFCDDLKKEKISELS